MAPSGTLWQHPPTHAQPRTGRTPREWETRCRRNPARPPGRRELGDVRGRPYRQQWLGGSMRGRPGWQATSSPNHRAVSRPRWWTVPPPHVSAARTCSTSASARMPPCRRGRGARRRVARVPDRAGEVIGGHGPVGLAQGSGDRRDTARLLGGRGGGPSARGESDDARPRGAEPGRGRLCAVRPARTPPATVDDWAAYLAGRGGKAVA